MDFLALGWWWEVEKGHHAWDSSMRCITPRIILLWVVGHITFPTHKIAHGLQKGQYAKDVFLYYWNQWNIALIYFLCGAVWRGSKNLTWKKKRVLYFFTLRIRFSMHHNDATQFKSITRCWHGPCIIYIFSTHHILHALFPQTSHHNSITQFKSITWCWQPIQIIFSIMLQKSFIIFCQSIELFVTHQGKNNVYHQRKYLACTMQF